MQLLNKSFLITAILGLFTGCSPESPSKPGPGPKPPVVQQAEDQTQTQDQR